ncbi:MAG TPA: protein kinase, partial [Gemmataceae bacterium]|nr:protein kinase [Gemmataceae bacterium]
MIEPIADADEREQRLDEAIAAYYEAIESGCPFDRAAFLARHPDLTEGLSVFLDDREAFERCAGGDSAILPLDSAPTVIQRQTTPLSAPVGIGRIGDYELLQEVGRGGMGIVYKARQKSLNRIVALKMILAGRLAAPGDVQRFRAEAEAAANLDHPNILPIYEVGAYQGQHFFSTKLIDGGSLAERLPELVGQPRRAVEPLAQVARAIHFAHRAALIHRDLKPANILLDADGRPYVADFGLAKRILAEPGVSTPRNVTQTGTIVGTPAYMPPEQARANKQLTTACDIYSLGAILYELLTGRPPFRRDTPLETLLDVLAREPVALRSLKPELDRDLETIVRTCLEKDPARRYRSAEALAEDLERWLAGEPISARAVGRAERAWRWCRRNPALAAASTLAAAALVAAVIATAGYGVEQSRRATEQGHATENLRRALDEARQQRHEAQRLSANFALERGLTVCALGDVRRGLLWIARSEQLAPEDEKALRRAARINLAEWGREVSPLRLTFPAPFPLGAGRDSTCVAITPDGRLIAVGEENAVRLWDARTGRQLGEPLEHGGPMGQVFFSPDGQRLLSGGSGNGPWRLWDPRTRQPVGAPLKESDGSQYALFSGESKFVLTVNRDGPVHLWDAVTGRLLRPLRLPDKTTLLQAVFLPNDRGLLAACSDRTVRSWDTATGEERARPFVHPQAVSGVALRPDGKAFLTGCADKNARLWSLETGKLLMPPWKHPAAVKSVGFSADGRRALTVAADTVRTWDAALGQLLTETQVPATPRHVRLTADGETLVVAEYGGFRVAVRFYDALTGLPSGQPLDESRGVWSLSLTPESREVIVGAHGAKLWGLPEHRDLGLFFRHDGPLTAAVFSPDGKQIATAGQDALVRIWDGTTGKPLGEPLPHRGAVNAIAFSPEGQTLLALSAHDTSWRPAGGTGEVQVHDAVTGKPRGGALPARLAIATRPDDKRSHGPVTSLA